MDGKCLYLEMIPLSGKTELCFWFLLLWDENGKILRQRHIKFCAFNSQILSNQLLPQNQFSLLSLGYEEGTQVAAIWISSSTTRFEQTF